MSKHHVTFVLFAVIAGLFAGCGGSRPPRATAQSFLENLAKGKLAEAKKHATEQTGQFLDFASSMGTIPADADFTFAFVSEKIDGDKSVVRFKGKDGSEDDIDLIKVNGEWKVHINKG